MLGFASGTGSNCATGSIARQAGSTSEIGSRMRSKAVNTFQGVTPSRPRVLIRLDADRRPAPALKRSQSNRGASVLIQHAPCELLHRRVIVGEYDGSNWRIEIGDLRRGASREAHDCFVTGEISEPGTNQSPLQ